jgi:hypothetical protein
MSGWNNRGFFIDSAALDESSRICLKPLVLFARLHEPPVAEPHGRGCGRGELNTLLDPIMLLGKLQVIVKYGFESFLTLD